MYIFVLSSLSRRKAASQLIAQAPQTSVTGLVRSAAVWLDGVRGAVGRMRGRLAVPRDVGDGFAVVVHDTLAPTTLALGVLYGGFAVAHALMQPARVAVVMTPVAAATAVVLALVWQTLRRRHYEPGRVHSHAAGVVGLALGNSLLHLALTLEPHQSTNFMLVAVGAGALMLSTRWFLAAMTVTLVSWLVVAVSAPASPEWIHFGFGLAVAAVLATLIQRGRLRSYIRIECARLAFREQAVPDPLTGLYNRAHLDAALARLVPVRRRDDDESRALSVALFDLDHFGRVNKERGHRAGDEALLHAAAVIASGVRAGDLLARYGGEEFAVVFEGSRDAAMVTAQRLRELLNTAPRRSPTATRSS